MTEEASGVRFTVKELLLEMRDDLKSLSTKLDAKADKSEVVTLISRIEVMEFKVREAEVREAQREQDSKETTDHRRWFLPLLIGCTSTVVSPFLWVIVGHIFK